MVQLVVCDYPTTGNERITSLKNGVVLEDGTVVDMAQAVAWYTGASASAYPGDDYFTASSLTYARYDGAIAPDKKLPTDEIEDLLNAGHVMFSAQKDRFGQEVAVVEQDRNTLTRYTEDLPPVWAKNAVVRNIYYLVSSISKMWHLYYIGKVRNNQSGSDLLKVEIGKLMDHLVATGAFEDFDIREDLIVEKGESSEAVVVQLAVRPVDAMEKMYLTVVVDLTTRTSDVTLYSGQAA